MDLADLCPEIDHVVRFVFLDFDLVEDVLRFLIAGGAGADLDIDGDLRFIPGADGDVAKLILYLQLIFCVTV